MPRQPAAAKDPILAAIQKAARAIKAVEKLALDDNRTTGTDVTRRLRDALSATWDAENWIEGLLKEEAADEKTPLVVEKAAPRLCHICQEDANNGYSDFSICAGCGQAICSDCMEDTEYCPECKEED